MSSENDCYISAQQATELNVAIARLETKLTAFERSQSECPMTPQEAYRLQGSIDGLVEELKKLNETNIKRDKKDEDVEDRFEQIEKELIHIRIIKGIIAGTGLCVITMFSFVLSNPEAVKQFFLKWIGYDD